MEEPLICDNGTGFIKVGRCNVNFPEFSVPSIVGKPHPNFAELIDPKINMNAVYRRRNRRKKSRFIADSSYAKRYSKRLGHNGKSLRIYF